MMMPFEWDVRVSSKDHTVTASTSYDEPATARYTTLRGTTKCAVAFNKRSSLHTGCFGSGRMGAEVLIMSDAAVPKDQDLDAALTSPLHLQHAAVDCPKCLTDVDEEWWSARPEGARLIGLVVARDGMPSVTQQREDLARFGVPIEGFRHPAPEILESWGDRLARLLGTLKDGDVLVVTNVHALGRDLDEEIRTVAELRRRGIMVKVLAHDGRHLADVDR